MIGCHTGLPVCLRRSQVQDPRGCPNGEVVDRHGLAVGSDLLLERLPQLVHRVELGPLLGQPDELDVELAREVERGARRVATGTVGQQSDRSHVPLGLAKVRQKQLHVPCTDARADEDRAAGGAYVDRAEQHPLGVLAGDSDLGLTADLGPHRAQRRKQPQQRPVGEQHHVVRPQRVLQPSDDPPFFAPTWSARSL